jgi:hypothetical protein
VKFVCCLVNAQQRRRPVRTPANIEMVRRRAISPEGEQGNHDSPRTIAATERARGRRISRTRIQRTIKMDLMMKSLTRVNVHMISPANRRDRVVNLCHRL